MPENMLKIPLTKGWPCHVRSAVLHIIALAQYATVYTRSWASNQKKPAHCHPQTGRTQSVG